MTAHATALIADANDSRASGKTPRRIAIDDVDYLR
jgi:hypothetical protein